MTPPAPFHLLSIQADSLGNGVYAQTLRDHFAGDPAVRMTAAWVGEGRTLPERVLYRLMDLRVPSRRVARGNLDLRRARNEAGTGMLARGLLLRRLAEAGRPDVLHFHTEVPALLSVGLMRRIPTVVTTDATAVNHAAIEGQPAWTHRPSLALDRRVFRAAARAVLFSEWARRTAVEAYGVDPARTRVIPPGVPTDQFPLRPADGAGGLPAGALPALLFVGNRVHAKGGEDVLAVYRERLMGRATLHVVTNDDLGGVPAGVTVHRGVAAYSPAWFALYAAADVFVLPTRIDPFGLVFIEAMAAGLPVVGTRINAVPEIVTDGEAGLLVPPADRPALAEALDALVGDAGLRARMGRAARHRAETHFERATNYGRLLACFREAAADPVAR